MTVIMLGGTIYYDVLSLYSLLLFTVKYVA